MSRQIIYIDRQAYDLGDRSDISAGELRTLAAVPDDRDLWQVADWSYREKLGGPMIHDQKITDQRIFLGPAGGRPARFFTAPRYINASSGTEPNDAGEDKCARAGLINPPGRIQREATA